MEALFLRVLTLSAACSLVLLPLLLCARRLTSRYAARTLYFLWLFLALRLIVPFQLNLTRPAVTVEVPRYEVSLPTGAAQPGPAGTPGLPLGAAGVSAAGGGAAAGQAAPEVSLVELLALAWLAVAALLLCVQTVSYLAARRRLLRASVPVPATAPGLKRPVPLYRCALVHTPMTLGLLRPVILLPEEEREAETLELVLRHEACHIRRRDVCYKALLLLAADLHWFNPLVWWMGRAAGQNLELCCDDAVLSGEGKEKRRKYGEILLNNASEGRFPTLCTHFGGGKRQMKDRLTNLFQEKRKSAAMVGAVLLAALLLGGLVACENAPKEGLTPEEAMDALEESVTFDWDMENVVFVIPEDYSPASDWNLHVSGRMEMGDGGTGMSLHYFEGEVWKPGSTGLINLTAEQRADVTALELTAALPDPSAEDGVLERTIDLRAWLNGEDGAGMPDLTIQPVPSQGADGLKAAGGNIRNLPEELYVVCPVHADKNVGRSSKDLSYDFQVEETMDFTLTVERASGTISIGVKNRDTGEYAVEPRAFGSEAASFRLDAGSYRLVLNMDTFQGTYHVTGAKAVQGGALRTGRLVYFEGGQDDTVLTWQDEDGTVAEYPVKSWDIPVTLLDGEGNAVEGTFGDWNIRMELDTRILSTFRLTLEDGAAVELTELQGGTRPPAGSLWPVEGCYHVTRLFGHRIHPVTKEPYAHLGIDIEAPAGTTVVAAADGTVAAVGRDEDVGNYVLVAHGGGWVTKYAGLTEITVGEGDVVARGAVMGRVAGEPEGEVLHFEWLGDDGTAAYDPLSKALFTGTYVKPDGTELTGADMEVPGW